MANIHLFPTPALVKQWQQEYNKLDTVSDSCIIAQETALARYTEQFTASSSTLSKAFTTALSWDKYQLCSPITPLPVSPSVYSSKFIQQEPDNNNYNYTGIAVQNMIIALLAQALCPRVLTLRVPAGSSITLDLSCLTSCLTNALASEHYGQYGLFVEHIKLYIEPEAHVTLVLSSNVIADTALVKFCEIYLGAYAQVTALLDDTLDATAQVLTHTRWYLAEHARLVVTHSSTGGGVTVAQAQYFLHERFAHVNHVSLYALAHDNQTLFSTEQQHYAPYTHSSVQVKQVVRDTARVFYEGLILLDRQAAGSVAEQEHAALLVSPQARASAVPALEIHNKEVRCRHASAIGAITAEYIWALQLRGLGHDQAQELIIEGFLRTNKTSGQVLDRTIHERLITYRSGI